MKPYITAVSNWNFSFYTLKHKKITILHVITKEWVTSAIIILEMIIIKIEIKID